MDRGYAAAAGNGAPVIPRPPSAYLRHFYTDTIVHDPAALALLVSRVGADHVLLGTDYPFEMGEDDPVALIRSVPGLDDSARTAMLGATAAGLLGR
jgi:aminocarboxymuconate-semialdehyde decarboxylase